MTSSYMQMEELNGNFASTSLGLCSKKSGTDASSCVSQNMSSVFKIKEDSSSEKFKNTLNEIKYSGAKNVIDMSEPQLAYGDYSTLKNLFMPAAYAWLTVKKFQCNAGGYDSFGEAPNLTPGYFRDVPVAVWLCEAGDPIRIQIGYNDENSYLYGGSFHLYTVGAEEAIIASQQPIQEENLMEVTDKTYVAHTTDNSYYKITPVNETYTVNDVEKNIIFVFYVDTNGNGKPNLVGRDLVSFYIDEEGNVHNATGLTRMGKDMTQ